MSRPYRKIVAQHHRDYPHTVTVPNGGGWRDGYLNRAQYAATEGALAMWFEEGKHVYGFKTADQAAAFKAWVDTCGIDWSTEPTDGPIPDFLKPPERPAIDPSYTGHSGSPKRR